MDKEELQKMNAMAHRRKAQNINPDDLESLRDLPTATTSSPGLPSLNFSLPSFLKGNAGPEKEVGSSSSSASSTSTVPTASHPAADVPVVFSLDDFSSPDPLGECPPGSPTQTAFFPAAHERRGSDASVSESTPVDTKLSQGFSALKDKLKFKKLGNK